MGLYELGLLPVGWERIHELWYNPVKGRHAHEAFGIYDTVRHDTIWLDKAPLTIISACRLPQREQTSRSRQSSTGVSAPYRAAISAGSGSTWMLAGFAPNDQADASDDGIAGPERASTPTAKRVFRRYPAKVKVVLRDFDVDDFGVDRQFTIPSGMVSPPRATGIKQ